MRIFTLESCGEEIEMVEIEVTEGQFTVMTKATYEAQQAKHLNGSGA